MDVQFYRVLGAIRGNARWGLSVRMGVSPVELLYVVSGGGEAWVGPGDEDVQFGYALSCDVARMMTTATMRRMMMVRKGSAFLDRPA